MKSDASTASRTDVDYAALWRVARDRARRLLVTTRWRGREEDVATEAIERCWERVRSETISASSVDLERFLLASVRWIVHEWCVRAMRAPHLDVVGDALDVPVDSAAHHESRLDLEHCVSRLPANLRAVVRQDLEHGGRASAVELSKMLHCTCQAIYNRRCRAHHELRRALR